MKNQFRLTAFLLLLAGCVPQADYDKLEKENNRLQTQVDSLSYEYDNLSEIYTELAAREIKRAQEQKKETYYSDEDAVNYIKDYYSFYKSGVAYRNIKVRKRDYNQFDVSLDECDKRTVKATRNDDFFWHSGNLRLVINDDGTYRVTGGLIH